MRPAPWRAERAGGGACAACPALQPHRRSHAPFEVCGPDLPVSSREDERVNRQSRVVGHRDHQLEAICQQRPKHQCSKTGCRDRRGQFAFGFRENVEAIGIDPARAARQLEILSSSIRRRTSQSASRSETLVATNRPPGWHPNALKRPSPDLFDLNRGDLERATRNRPSGQRSRLKPRMRDSGPHR